MSLVSQLLRPLGGEPSRTHLVIDGQPVPVVLRRNRQARKYILRLDKAGNGVVVTLPARASERKALEFAASHAGWIRRQLATRPVSSDLADGDDIPLRGHSYRLRHHPNTRGSVWCNDEEFEINVAGYAEHLPRRLRDWLKKQARADLLAASQGYADAMGLKYSRITVRDQSTRWGSCSSNGSLSYSWRLILAPPDVLDYVAAHEVAHLREMNHSPRFWKLVETHCPHAAGSRRWLKEHGQTLHRFGL